VPAARAEARDKARDKARANSRATIALLWLLLASVPLVCLELLGFALTKVAPDLFDQRQSFLESLRADDLERFKQSVASNTLGWDNPAGPQPTRNCVGEEITYTHSIDRIRLHGSTPSDAIILVAGDSYAHGDEVADYATYPAELERLLAVPVVNLGVGGYGPEQALLKLEGMIDRFPKARVAVLSIMYENTRRMVNSYRPVYYPDTGMRFGFKPFMRDGALHGLIGGDPFRDLPALLKAADDAFANDFWARPRPQFPFAVSAIRAIAAPAFWVPALDSKFISIDIPQHRVFYSLPGIKQSLRALYDRFAGFAQSRKLHPVVAFIPPYQQDHTSGLIGIAAATDEQRRRISFVNVGDDFDWSRFFRGCHPSADGYAMIAAGVARIVRPLLADR
jgi:hypothetical protein